MKTDNDELTLFGDFMGLKRNGWSGNDGGSYTYFEIPNCYPYHDMDDPKNTGWIVATVEEFSFDWNWIMKVVEKISGMDELNQYVEYLNTQCDEGNKEIGEILTISDLTIFADKELVCKMALNFIKWYNTQTPMNHDK